MLCVSFTLSKWYKWPYKCTIYSLYPPTKVPNAIITDMGIMWKFPITTSLCCWRVITSCQHLLCKSSREEKRGSGFQGLVYRTLTVHLLFFLAALEDLSDLVQIWLIWKQDHHHMWYVLCVVFQRGERTISYRSRSRMSTVYMYHNEQQWTSCNLSSQQHHLSQRRECVM